ncbi:mucin-2-like [Ischnura elegans]|uniref:mucin-2-like n=1 Tax=Ischnura elegans TaxID=197161 RepID=UPI001ED89171|nr:mucin-2-like [Ischnura elegans]
MSGPEHGYGHWYKAFECPPTSQETIFPDPFSCAEYHICASGKSLNFVCPHEKPFFDPKLKQCVKSTAQGNDCRQPPVPVCNRKGDKGTLEGTSYAYECVEDTSPYRILYPKLSLIVKQGIVFSDEALVSSDMPPPSTMATKAPTVLPPSTTATKPPTKLPPSTMATKPPTAPTSSAPATKQSTALPSTPMGGSTMEQSSTSPSQQPSSSLPPTLSTSPGLSTTPKPSPCTNGSGAYPVPNDCRKYLLCYVSPDGSIQHKEKECRDGSHFDSGAQRCVAGSCTSFPTTVSSPSTEVTTAVPIACKADGILPDKDCCRCYYVCYTVGSTLDYVHRCCRTGSHFDKGLKSQCRYSIPARSITITPLEGGITALLVQDKVSLSMEEEVVV